MDVLGQYIRSVREAGYPVLPPDINESREDFTVVGDVIRLGLSAIAKVGHGAVINIIESREKKNKFTTFWDFMTKIDTRVVNKGVIENLIKAGAFDSIDTNRAKLLGALPMFLDSVSKRPSDVNQCSLFSEEDSAELEPVISECEDFTTREKLDFEKESMGLYISGHPFDQYEPKVREYINCPLIELGHWMPMHIPVVTAGLLASSSEKFTKKGDPMGILTVEDSDTTVEIVVFPKMWPKVKPYLKMGGLFIIKGQPRSDRGISVLADEIFSEEDFADNLEPHVIISIDSDGLPESFYTSLFKVFSNNPGHHELILKMVSQEQTVVSQIKQVKIDPTDKFLSELERTSGVRAVRI